MEEVKDYQIKELKKRIFISNLKAWIVGIILIAEIAFFAMYFSKAGMFGEPVLGDNKVAVIHFDELITEKYTTKVMEKMDVIRKDKNFKEVLFVMGSPGGSPTASEELSEYLKAYQKDKNITMYIGSIAASGGYYIASAIQPLYANKNAIVGSIGVIMPHYNLGELAEKVGIEEDNLAAGKYKQPISLFKKVEGDEKKYIEDHLLMPTYENFINAVVANRGITKEKLLPFTEGKIYVANAPEIQGVLVDKITSLYQIKKEIRQRLGEKTVKFETMNLKDQPSFFPKVQVDMGVDKLLNQLSYRQ
ncbi:signal peptide peptidase SppA [Sulfurovum sp. zt1-1]|uniref:Signal peptide peptidase SppA n=1 Tax=Sulfurovum zhangzhouensis TaxID=3019067 RepID=A0ABT7QX86_9BACT|nr:signal peptide peptidase SppA [Sulfurovum zhangzhouensis]MDM5270951.1 signal peptide peptidase SppA [Sulfurovum zhangzhouensis]